MQQLEQFGHDVDAPFRFDHWPSSLTVRIVHMSPSSSPRRRAHTEELIEIGGRSPRTRGSLPGLQASRETARSASSRCLSVAASARSSSRTLSAIANFVAVSSSRGASAPAPRRHVPYGRADITAKCRRRTVHASMPFARSTRALHPRSRTLQRDAGSDAEHLHHDRDHRPR